MGSELVEQLINLLDEEKNNYSISENVIVKEEDDIEGHAEYKSGARETCPAGHKYVYVFCVDSKNLMSKMIIKTTRRVFDKKASACHVSLSFDKSLTKMYSFVVGTNFRVENIRSTYKPEATFSLYKIAVPNTVFMAMQDAVKNIELLKGTKDEIKYHTKGILAFFMSRKYQEKMGSKQGVMFCSQFVAKMFATAGMPVFSKPDYQVQPYEFMRNKNFKFCYRGKVKNFDSTKVR